MTALAITGLGAVTPGGRGIAPLWTMLRHGQGNFAPPPHFTGLARVRGVVGLVPGDAPSEHGSPDRTLTLTVESGRQALGDAGLPGRGVPADMACVVGTTDTGGRALHLTHDAYRRGEEPPVHPGQALSAMLAERVAERLGLPPGGAHLVGNASASGAVAIGFARDLVLDGQCSAALAAAGDALDEAAYSGLASLRLLTTAGCRTYNRDRSGIHVSEGAGALVLEEVSSARRRGAHVHAFLVGYGSANARGDLVRLDPTSVELAIRAALDDAGCGASDVGVIKMHGTGTPHGDLAEVAALRAVFGLRLRSIPMASWKPTLGHCQGAAGAIEAVGVSLAVGRRRFPPTTRLDDLDPAFADLNLVTTEAELPGRTIALAMSCGFSGTTAAVLIANPDVSP